MKLEAASLPPFTLERVAAALRERPEATLRSGRLKELALDPDWDLVEPPEAGVSLPHVTYVLGLDAVDAEDPISLAQAASVRFLVDDGDAISATAEILMDDLQAERHLPSVTTGDAAAEMASLVRAAEAVEGPEPTFEVRLLRVPALHIDALWLHAGGDDDLFWRLAGPGRLPTDQPVGRGEFVDRLRDLAAAWHRADAGSADGDDSPLAG